MKLQKIKRKLQHCSTYVYVSLKLSDWWTNVAYLEFRQPVTVNVSPGVVFPKQNYTDKEGQLRYNQCHYLPFM